MSPKRCPKCSAALVQRKNSNTQAYFWGCSAFPKCRGVLDEKRQEFNSDDIELSTDDLYFEEGHPFFDGERGPF
jgi:ssDNA-binding Zn-finger/Zn-ribbon topoisomerase 1